jgi:hypothetical protein
MNHPPAFISISNDGPTDPGDTVTWTSDSYDNDATGTPDTLRIFVCKAADFTGTYCGVGGSWATSTTYVATDVATTATTVIPSQDKTYDAYVYIADQHGLVATSTIHGSNSSFVISNVAPTITAATMSLEDVDGGNDLTISVAMGTSGPFRLEFSAVDNNSCLNSSSGNELNFAVIAAYRSGVAQTGCNDSGEYNSNNCYAATSTLFNGMSCQQATSSPQDLCSGASDPAVDWVCTFPLWYNADPTDATTPWTAENWMASARIQDDNFASSTLTEGTSGDEVTSLLAFNVSSTSIQYGGLEPGQTLAVSTTSDFRAEGNVGLDQDIYGATMCTDFSSLGGPGNPDACDTNGVDPTRDIPATTTQKVATSSLAYSHPEAYFIGASTTPFGPLSFEIRVPKTTSTSSPATRYNYWGISIPSAITLAGSYTGQDTIIGKKSNISFW